MADDDLLAQLRIDKTQRSGGKTRHYGLGASAVVVALALLIGSWFYLKSGAKMIRIVTATAPTAAGGSAPVLDAAGYVTARREATVSAKITGMLQEVLIEEGERVERGQTLARLDPSDAEAQLGLAQAQAAAARAGLAELDARWAQAGRDLFRQQELAARGFTPVQQLENARTEVASLEARIAVQKSAVKTADAGVAVAGVALDNTIVRAPFSGIITAKSAQPGEIVSPISAGGGFTRTGIGTIVDMDSLEIEVDVNEAYINRVRPGQKATAVLDAYQDWVIPAAVIAIIPTADRAKATVKVRISIEAKDARIVPDMGVKVSLYDDEQAALAAMTPAKGVVVPKSAIVQRGGRDVVFLYDQKIARQRGVTVGADYGDLRQVTDGLAIGDQLIRAPKPDLIDGAKVQREDGQ